MFRLLHASTAMLLDANAYQVECTNLIVYVYAPVPKVPHAESQGAKMSLCQKVHNLHGDEMPHAEMFL